MAFWKCSPSAFSRLSEPHGTPEPTPRDGRDVRGARQSEGVGEDAPHVSDDAVRVVPGEERAGHVREVPVSAEPAACVRTQRQTRERRQTRRVEYIRIIDPRLSWYVGSWRDRTGRGCR
jgi:hypothetical protein